jgi:hypothetical protein
MNSRDALGVRTWCRCCHLSLLQRIYRSRGIVALAGALCFAPCGIAQHEVSPDHFTESGVEGVWPLPDGAGKQVAHARANAVASQPKSKRVVFRNASRKTAVKPGN